MSPEQKPAPMPAARAGTAPLTEPARRAWSVQFVPTPPKAMPSDRLQARAELVRSAHGCSTY